VQDRPAHDLGHAPFGHAGEEALRQLLEKQGLDWNSNAHSLTVVEEIETQYCEHPGLNLTWATREGLACHSTQFDIPMEAGQDFGYRQPSLEAQAANVADVIAYSTHDVEDALAAGLLAVEDLRELHIEIWDRSWEKAETEFGNAHPQDWWPGGNRDRLLARRAHRHMIDLLIRDAVTEAANRVSSSGVFTIDDARATETPLLAFSPTVANQVDQLLTLMKQRVYKSPLVARQNYRASHILSHLFEAFVVDDRMLPEWIQEQVRRGTSRPMAIARFLAGLTDRSAADLYAELFEPSDRAMGHRIM